MSSVTISLPFEIPSTVILALVAFGAIYLLSFLLSFLRGLGFFLYSGVNIKKFGEWAVVTGATDGIGKAYAQLLARKGLNVVLISRSKEKLESVEKEIRDESKVQVKIVEADFSQNNPDTYLRIENELKDLNIAILVNNVGMSYPHAQFFEKVDEKLIDDLIAVNVTSLTKLTRIVLPGLAAKKKGIIVNVGSAAGLVPIGDPLYAVYSGTKAYVDFFSKSLNVEYRGKGVIIENHVPYFVTSKLSKIRSPSITTPAPRTYAAATISKIGYAASVVPFWAHAIQHWVLVSLPEPVLTYFVWQHHFGIYKRAMKKLQEKKD